MLIKESDFDTISHLLKGLDVVEKMVYDLYRLTNWYLSKQAGATYNRILPTKNISLTKIESVQLVSNDTATIIVVKQFVSTVIKRFQRVLINHVFNKRLKKNNKIDSIHRYIDDT